MTPGSARTDPANPIFISYRHSDGTDITAELAWLLRAAGIPVWRDRDDLPPGDTEARLAQAIASGIAGAVLVITPDIGNSRIVRALEAPQLFELHQQNETFALGIANAVKTESGQADYNAPDHLLGFPTGTLSGVDQRSADRENLVSLVSRMAAHRIASLRDRVKADDQTFHLSVQTRNTPQVYDRTGDELDIRLRPSADQRLPSAEGLQDLKDTLDFLPDAVTRSGARHVRVAGGAHLCVAFALGAALPSSRVGHMEVVDHSGATWASAGEAQFPSQPRIQVVSEGRNPSALSLGRPTVAVYADLLPTRSDAAYTRYIEQQEPFLSAWRHLTHTTNLLIDPSEAGLIAAEIVAHIRALSDENANADIHLMLRCPFPLAVLVGRLTNTLRLTLYEWDDSDPVEGEDFRPRYVPALRVHTSAGGGVIRDVLLPDRT